ncbi:hypothetical protein [Candidatus Nitrosocosmicus arcticus]|uniref:hypothetical protein n=1 Tax=Candidatus Nitrosocosmicus arcticus TaxID=2035267 RepID=UPI0011A0A12A|nr:hypothetical protein [Candidatus Nitrosocosmicus arcticus]
MTNQNIVKCFICNGVFIEEEYTLHTCKGLRITVFDLSGNRWGSYDNINFFPLPSLPKISPPKTKHPFSTPDDETEPIYVIIYVANFC